MGLQVQAPIAVTGAAFTPITAAAFSRYTEIAEDGSGAAAGLIVEWPNGNVDEYPPSQQPIKIGNPTDGVGPFVGVPLNGVRQGYPATVYCNIKSMGANTEVRVSERN